MMLPFFWAIGNYFHDLFLCLHRTRCKQQAQEAHVEEALQVLEASPEGHSQGASRFQEGASNSGGNDIFSHPFW